MKVKCAHDELVSIKKLIPHPKNRNKHPKEQIARLAKVLEYQGVRRPVRVSELSGYITAGHCLYEAAKLLKWKELPVDYQPYDSEDQEIADGIADNSIALWADLDFAGINMDVPGLGPDFDIDWLGIKDFVIEPAEKIFMVDEDSIPSDGETETRVKPGQIWQLGNHRVMCGDSTDKNNIDALMNGEKADMLCWDPPWNVGFEYNSHDDSIDHEKYGVFISGCLNAFYSVAKPSYVAVCWQSEKNWAQFHKWFPREARIIAVMKNFVQLSKSFLQRAWDPALMWVGDKYEFLKINGHNQRDYLIANTAATTQTPDRVISGKHPCPRTVDTYEYFITGWAKPSANIVDLSLGSGTALIACEKTNRKCYGMEIDPHYCDVIIARWEKYTGGKAILANG